MTRNAIAVALTALALQAHAQSAEVSESAEAPAFERRASELLIADPKSILNVRKTIQQNSAARQAPIVADFEPEIPQEVLDLEDMFDITLEPDQMAPKVFISRYQSTAVSFVDVYGNPWPIRKISNFMGGLITIDKATEDDAAAKSEGGKQGIPLDDPQAGSFTLTAMKHGVVGNMTVYLYNLATPISINFVGKSSMFHRAATMRVRDIGPQTDTSLLLSQDGVTVGTEADGDLNNVLYGAGPLGSEQMVVSGGDGKAWIKGEHLFLQTSIDVFSPEILRASHGNGKFRAYKLPKTTAVMGTNSEGKTVSLRIMRHPAVDAFEQTSLTVEGR